MWTSTFFHWHVIFEACQEPCLSGKLPMFSLFFKRYRLRSRLCYHVRIWGWVKANGFPFLGVEHPQIPVILVWTTGWVNWAIAKHNFQVQGVCISRSEIRIFCCSRHSHWRTILAKRLHIPKIVKSTFCALFFQASGCHILLVEFNIIFAGSIALPGQQHVLHPLRCVVEFEVHDHHHCRVHGNDHDQRGK